VDEYGVARRNGNVVGGIVGQLPAQRNCKGLVGLVAMGHRDGLTRPLGKTAGRGNDVVQSRFANHRIYSGPSYLSEQAYTLGRGLIDVQGHVWIFYETSVRQPFFD
jgi:hypothetical protein